MIKSFIYTDILNDIGWFDSVKPFKKLAKVNYIHFINGIKQINKDTVIAYFPGCFAHFHEGHISVIDEMKDTLEKQTDNYVIVLAPANSDYTVSKYGADSVYASNKYRYDRITQLLTGYDGNVAIDLNPMLNNDRDYNFTDLLKDFVERHVADFDYLKHAPYIMCGKDRAYFKNLELLTKKIRIFYADDATQLSSSGFIKEKPKQIVKKVCHLRCKHIRQLELFKMFFRNQYSRIEPIFLEDELTLAKEKSKDADVTICKDYADILPYVPFHREFTHPLISNNSHTGDSSLLIGKRVLDSDVFTGGTERSILALGGSLVSVMDFSSKTEEHELVDFNDFLDGKYRYPYYDIATRCSMRPFTYEDHKNLTSFKRYIKTIWGN